MIILVLVALGLILGSFVNALVWRIHEQSKSKKVNKASSINLSITRGRSMCPHCKHALGVKDLVPIFSWILLRGKCRYCKKPISVQYPLVEASTALLFVASYIWWPDSLTGAANVLIFLLWLVLVVGFMALIIYDLKWYLLPNRIIYPLTVIALLQAALSVYVSNTPVATIIDMVLAVLIGGGIFYVLFQASKGKWIGGGDVRLGWLLGLVVATPAGSVLFIFIASLIGTLFSLPLLLSSKLKRTSVIPFGPFLIVGAIIVQLFGQSVINWYQHTFLNF